jgi:tetratricopeptide (TPR) repeat protein
MKKIAKFVFIISFFSLNLFAQTANRVSLEWRVTKYDITASLPQTPTDRYLTAKAILNLQNIGSSAGSRLTLRINEKAEISAVQVNNVATTFTKGQESIGGNRNIQRIALSVPSVPPDGNVSVSVDYKLKVDDNSGLNALSPIGSQFLPLSFWYPTPNSHYAARGADFAPFTLRVTSGNEKVISSGTQTGTTYEQKLNGQPFFITGSWDTVESKGVSVFLPKGVGEFEKQRANELANLAVEANTFAASLLGTAPSVPLKIVAVRRGSGFADAGTILLDNAVFRRQKIDSQTAMTIAESIAKIWLGNAKIVRGEGYGATQFIEKQFGKDAAENERMRQRVAYAVISRSEIPYNQASPLDPSYYSSVANKGAMVWREVARRTGQDQFFSLVKSSQIFTLAGFKSSLPNNFDILDDAMTNSNEMNLLVGLPQVAGSSVKVALRNTGAIAATVNVAAMTDKGEKLVERVTVNARSFAEVTLNTTSKIIRTEVDPEKYFPQVDYSDDVAPREFTESNPLIVIKRSFDKKDNDGYIAAEKDARTVLKTQPHLDDARTWLGRALLGQNKLQEAEKEFQAALAETLPTVNTLGWANVGLGDVAAKSNQMANAAKYYDEAIKADTEYGATLAARIGKKKSNQAEAIDESIKTFFSQLDKAVVAGRKAEIDTFVLPGETSRLAGGISGQAEQWQTTVVKTDKIDANNALVEVNLSIKLLNRDPESGTAVFYLSKLGDNWKLSGVEIFEVR